MALGGGISVLWTLFLVYSGFCLTVFRSLQYYVPFLDYIADDMIWLQKEEKKKLRTCFGVLVAKKKKLRIWVDMFW